MKKTIFSLALGTFGLGMAEFGIMGVLPDMAHDVGISIPAAGNMIALVCLRRGDRRADHGAALQPVFPEIGDAVLAGLCILGNTLFTFSSSYAMLALGRLVSGFSPRGVLWRRRDYPVENRAAGEGDRRGGGDDWRHDDR